MTTGPRLNRMTEFELNVQQNWHSERKLYFRLEQLHRKYALFGENMKNKAESHFKTFLEQLEKCLRENVSTVFNLELIEYTGSSYEKLRVESSPLEFEVMVILSGGSSLDAVDFKPRKPGFVKLRCKPGCEGQFWMYRNPSTGYLTAVGAQNEFRRFLQKVIQNYDDDLRQVSLPAKHWPALQLDMKHGDLEYSVILELAFEIVADYGLKEYYVAKRFREEGVPDVDDADTHGPIAWRRSFALEEKKTLLTIDSDRGCRMMCARIFKVLRDNAEDLEPIFSYLIRTTLFYIHVKYDFNFWAKGNIGKCIMAFMWELAISFESGRLDHFFIHDKPYMNLLETMREEKRRQVANRLQELVKSDTEFYGLLDSIEGLTSPEFIMVNGVRVRPVP